MIKYQEFLLLFCMDFLYGNSFFLGFLLLLIDLLNDNKYHKVLSPYLVLRLKLLALERSFLRLDD